MIIVSLLVHERKEVVLDLLLNFKKFFPDALVVVHVSKQASFSIDDLQSSLKDKTDNFAINPTQVETYWGGILPAHFANVKYAHSIDPNAQVIFHSSNELFVRHGVEEYIAGKNYLFNHRHVYSSHTFWWPGAVATQDPLLKRILASLGTTQIVASQLEGSMYHMSFLMELIRISENYNFFESKLFYAREEIFLSSVASALKINSDGLPYVFSEVHRFDRVLWKTFLDYPIIAKNNLLRKIVNHLLFKSKFYKITNKDIDAIRQCKLDYLDQFSQLYDGESSWDIFDPRNLFAVKRVEREINDPLRTYIRNLT